MTDRERKELEESEVGFCVNALTDPNVTQEEISNKRIDSLLGKGLQAFAINYKVAGGGANQSFVGLQDEINLKANQTDVDDLVDIVAAMVETKADKTDIVDPKWGFIIGNLADQTDLVHALSAKASLSDLAAVDTRTRTLENTIATKVDQSALNATVNTLNAAIDLKPDASYVNQMLDTKASKDAVDAKANTTDVEERFAQMTTVVNGKASATMWSNVEIPVSGWSASAPYTQTVTVNGMLATCNPLADIKFTDITDNTAMADEESYYNCVDHIAMGDNSITLICLDEKPAGTFHIKMREVS